MLARSHFKRSEASRQAEGVQLLQSLGYTVLESGKTRKAVTCPQCSQQFHPSGWQGNSVGLPDTMVTHPSWPGNTWMMIEWKVPGGDVRKEQQDLVNHGMSVIVTDAKEACEAVCLFQGHVFHEEVMLAAQMNNKLRRAAAQL